MIFLECCSDYSKKRPDRSRLYYKISGFTVPEVLTVAFLIGIVFFLVAQLMVPSVMLFRIQSARSDVQQGGLIFVSWINKAISNSMLDTVTVNTKPVSISFIEMNETDPYDTASGKPKLMNRFTILWFDEKERKVKYRYWPPAPPPPPSAPVPATYPFATSEDPLALNSQDLTAICNTYYSQTKILAKNVEYLKIDDDDGDATTVIHPPLRFTIVCSAQSGTRRNINQNEKEEKFCITTQVYPRTNRW